MHLASTETQETYIKTCKNTNGPNGAIVYASWLKYGPERKVHAVGKESERTGLIWKKVV